MSTACPGSAWIIYRYIHTDIYTYIYIYIYTLHVTGKGIFPYKVCAEGVVYSFRACSSSTLDPRSGSKIGTEPCCPHMDNIL